MRTRLTEPEGPDGPTTMGMTSDGRPAGRRWRPALLAWAVWALAMLCLAPISWVDHLLRQAGRPDLVQLNASGIANGYAIYGAVVRPEGLPAARQVAVYADSATLVGRLCIAFVLLLTPTGS